MKPKFAAGHTPCLVWQPRRCLNTCQGQEQPRRPQRSEPNRPRGIMHALAPLPAPGSAGVPMPRALFSQKGIRWLQGAAAGTRKMPWKTVCKQPCCCGRQGVCWGSRHSRLLQGGIAHLSHIPQTSRPAGQAPSPSWAGWHRRLGQLNTSSTGSSAARVAGERGAGWAGRSLRCWGACGRVRKHNRAWQKVGAPAG